MMECCHNLQDNQACKKSRPMVCATKLGSSAKLDGCPTPKHTLVESGNNRRRKVGVGKNRPAGALTALDCDRSDAALQNKKTCGLAIISQKIANTAAKAGNPKANHHRNNRR